MVVRIIILCIKCFLIIDNSIIAKIQLNGKKVLIKTNYSIFDLLKKYKLSNKKIAIEHNGVIISKEDIKKKQLRDNDKLEIVHFIGGG